MSFDLPPFFSYPPYFTLQPVKETRDRQSKLWGDLILSYCGKTREFVLDVESDSFHLFSNPSISRKLPVDARRLFLDDLVTSGSAEWLDGRSKRQCLILWKRIPEWAAAIYSFVQTFGLGDSVMTLSELSTGDDVRGTDIHGIHREVLVRALKLLEAQGKARIFQGATPEEEGVKFL